MTGAQHVVFFDGGEPTRKDAIHVTGSDTMLLRSLRLHFCTSGALRRSSNRQIPAFIQPMPRRPRRHHWESHTRQIGTVVLEGLATKGTHTR
jgi:hypothetical protein